MEGLKEERRTQLHMGDRERDLAGTEVSSLGPVFLGLLKLQASE